MTEDHDAGLVEAAALAAWLAYARPDEGPQDWWDDDDWAAWNEPETRWREWPEGCTHIGADGFRHCAGHAIAAVREHDAHRGDGR